MNLLSARWQRVGLCCVLAVATGCGSAAPRKKRHRDESAPLTGVAAAKPVAIKEVEAASLDAFKNWKPPFAEREELFVPPNPEIAQKLAKIANSAPDVLLKGVVNVGGIRAILEVGGEMVHARPGETIKGIEVVEIHADGVVLRRGQKTWTAPLREEDETVTTPTRAETPVEEARPAAIPGSET